MNVVTGHVDSVQLATSSLDPTQYGFDAARDDAGARLLGDGDVLWVIRGGQGASMVPVRLIYRGSDVPSCVAQNTTVTVAGKLAAQSRENLATYPYAIGVRATKTLWLPGAFATEAVLTSDTTGFKPSVAVRTASTLECISVSACPCSRMLACASCTTGFSDAGAALRAQLLACDKDRCPGDPGCPACNAERQACAADLF
jgi:hypothetical protein